MKYWMKLVMCRKLVLSDTDIGKMAVNWGLDKNAERSLRSLHTNYKKSIVKRVDEALHHWFEGIGNAYNGVMQLTREQGMAVLEDEAKIRRIFAPIDVLADNVWTSGDVQNKWIKVFTARACTYVCNAAPFVKRDQRLPSAKIDEWYVLPFHADFLVSK
jgi:hypothetical protein